MIPLKDHNPTSTFPFIAYILIILNSLIFLYESTLTPTQLESFFQTYAFIPAQGITVNLITATFLHGSWGHLIGNMLFLNIFGDNLEDRLGHLGFLIFYLLTGFIADLPTLILDPNSTIPNLGASGAIAGLMGGYLYLFPNHRIDILLPIGGLFRTTAVPAYTMLIYWGISQFFGSVGQLATLGDNTGGVAYLAHLGGFLGGLLLIIITNPFIKKTNT